jgi:fumarate hydratase class I
VVGGTSAERTVKTAKLASTQYSDSLPTTGDAATGHASRDQEVEAEVLKITQKLGIGAQFGGKYFCHDVRVVRLPRHGASLPIAIAVSCSADRQAKAKITKDGIFIEDLEREPAHFLPETTDEHFRR